MDDWQVNSWQKYPAEQQPSYDNHVSSTEALQRLQNFPPLVSNVEIEQLRNQLLKVQAGQAFILQGGDCAEMFRDCRQEKISTKLNILATMATLMQNKHTHIIKIGRIAGQYAKPRSQPFTSINGKKINSYLGDSINALDANSQARKPSPQRMLDSYFYAATTLNFIQRHYGDTEFFTSHEGLLLPYEQAMSRQVSGNFYNLGAHMLWIGARTGQLQGAHVELFRGVENPLGIKVSKKMTVEQLVAVVRRLNPHNQAGKIILITRLGKDNISSKLPLFIKACKQERLQVIWSVDPMHGNTHLTSNGVKTRSFRDICVELETSFLVHRQLENRLGGVHFELTGENVTECLGGQEKISEDDLHRRYDTGCDPRLNRSQSIEIAKIIAQHLR